jgi:hypothetical protein
MKVTVIMTVSRQMDLDFPEGGTPHECDASAIAQLVEDIKTSVIEDPLLFVDSEDATIDVKVES